jgi:signal transduction histidine kinase/ligand-binding sensor domain-containing protein
MKRYLFIGLLAAFSFLGKPAIAQNPAISFEHLTSEDGLPSSTILDISQDKKGFMWFATLNGLFRYDGYNFASFKTEVNNNQSISDNWISSLFEDREGIIYVGTLDQGLNIYNNKKENFTRYKTNHGANSLGSDKIKCIKEDSLGIIWIGTADRGFYSYNKKEKNFTSFSLPSECINNCIDMVIDKDNNLWIINSMLELVKFQPKTKEFIIINNSFSGKQKSDEIKSKLLLDKNGNIWIGTNLSGLYYYNIKNNFTKHWINDLNNPKSLNSNLISDIQETSDGKIWIATDGGGIDIFDIERGEFYHNTNNLNDPGSLSTNSIYCLYSDKNHNIWAGTYLGGINIYNSNRKKFSYYKPNSTNQTGLVSNSVLAIYQDEDNDLLIGTDGGSLNQYNKEKYGERFIDFKRNGNDEKNASPIGVESIYQTKDGTIWIGTWKNGLVKFDKKDRKFSYLGWDKGNPEKISGPIVYSIMEDDNNLLWLAVWPFGVDVYDWKSNKVVKHYTQSNGFKGTYPSKIIKDSKGRIWIGTYEAGLNRYIANSDTFVNYQYDSNNLRSLSSNQVSTIFEDSKGNIWIGTLGGGLNKYDEKTDDFTVINENYGLISNEIAGILEDQNGNFWISSYKGIFKFSPTTYKTRNYDVDDGLQGSEFNDCATFKAKDGRLYFGGTKGFNAFYPDQIIDNSFNTPLYITSFSIFNKLITVNSPDSILNQSIIETKEITLPYNKSVFTFEFTALNFNHSKKNQYAYRMENFETEWNKVGNKRYATYTNLDPGKYTFMVKTTNNDGVWNEIPTTIKITITPPYWKTWWFTISIVLFIIGFVVFIFIWRTRQLKMQKKMLEIKVRERTNELEDANTALEEQQEEILQQSEGLKAMLNQLKQTQNQLIQAEKMASLGILSAGVAHEINNPLNYIMGAYVGLDEFFKETADNDARIPILLNGIKTGVDRASDIVKGLNQFSRNNETLIEDCNIHSIINNCLVMLNNQLRERIEVNKIFCNEEIRIVGNVGKLHQVFINILSNSIQAIDKNGSISISTYKYKKTIFIEISDTGYGISKENLSKVTDPFFTTKEPGKGTGLGLSIAYSIIQDHKGTIEFQSEINSGTTVIISLPANNIGQTT